MSLRPHQIGTHDRLTAAKEALAAPTATNSSPDPGERCGRRWNVNVGVYDVVEEVGHPELHRERDDLEDLRVYVSGLPNRLKVGVADFAVRFRLPSSRWRRRRCA